MTLRPHLWGPCLLDTANGKRVFLQINPQVIEHNVWLRKYFCKQNSSKVAFSLYFSGLFLTKSSLLFSPLFLLYSGRIFGINHSCIDERNWKCLETYTKVEKRTLKNEKSFKKTEKISLLVYLASSYTNIYLKFGLYFYTCLIFLLRRTM